MDFKTFIDKNIDTNQDDPISNEVIKIVKNDKEFPKTSDIKSIASHIYNKLDHGQTTAFQKLLLFWKFAENNYKQPTDPKLLNEINYIIDLQDRNQ